jgi:cytochrome c biogenesis protein CcmG/thiol:disulfide interchange protein DsbE
MMTAQSTDQIRTLARSLFALFIAASVAFSQSTAPPVDPASPPSPVTGIRNKISAGDLLSAESILEVYRTNKGENGQWLLGLSWLARGALLVGDVEKAELYVAKVRASCADRLSRGFRLDQDRDLEIAYGAAIEAKAQLLDRMHGANEAAKYLRDELAIVNGPPSLVSRLYKRLNMLTLVGETAPDLEPEDFIGNLPPTLASLRERPVLLFVWAHWCGDCKAQAAGLARIKSVYSDRGLQIIALTRFYDPDSLRTHEKFQIDSIWNTAYADVGTVPMVISTASMERYGGSSTPTFVFIDRAGIVRRYTPTRLTEEEMYRTLDQMME